MIPQKEKNGNLDEQLNKDIEEAEKKSKEDVKNSKPKLAQAAAMKYAKYATILFLIIGIVYKMFFSGTDAKLENKKNAKKQTKKTNKKTKTQQQQDNFKNTSTISIKDRPEKQNEDKMKEITSNTLTNAENLKLVAVPKTETPELPKLPDIKTITITQEGTKNETINKDLEKKLEAQQKEIEELKKQNENNKKKMQEFSKKKDSKKNKKNKKNKNKEEEQDDRGLLNSSPLSQPVEEQEENSDKEEKKEKKEKKPKTSNSKKNNQSKSENSLLEKMFVLTGKGSKQKKETTSSNSKNDFVIFDNSSISVKEEVSEKEASSVKKMANLEYTIMSGKVIDGVLETAIDSQFSGTIRGIVSKDVYGEIGDKILIPKGSRLYGSYTKSTSKTQYRLLLTWSKIVRPDGVVISVNLDTYDQIGRKGIEGDVNTQYGELFKNSLLYSFVTLGTAVALEKIAGIKGTTISSNGATSYATISPATTAAQSVVATAQDIAEKMTDGITDDLDSIITIPQGIQLKIMPSSDIVIPTPYKRKKYNINFD